MSKKEKRRAARQAFPKAKSAPAAASRGRYAGGARGRTSGASRSRTSAPSRSRAQGGSQALRPPSIKKAVITGAILALIYFAFIQWGWKSGSTTEGNALISFIVFFVYSGVVYGAEKFRYQRKLRKMNGSSK